MMRYKRIFLFVLDGCGCGEQKDYREYHSESSNTLGSLFKNHNKFTLPRLESLGLSQLLGLRRDSEEAIYAKLREESKGNDTFAGVWEMMGEPFLKRFASRQTGFSAQVLREIHRKIGLKPVGNEYISGYKALDKYYAEHVKSEAPIVYFSDDGVILFAGHQNVISPDHLNRRAASLARVLKNSDYARIITRPFTGKPGSFIRMEKYRKDFIVNGSTPKLLQLLVRKGVSVRITEHLYHLFGNPGGVSVLRRSPANDDLMRAVAKDFRARRKGFFMYVFQDTDNYGHKKNLIGFQRALSNFDKWLNSLTKKMRPADLLMITADHGCNPTLLNVRGHNREYVPLLIFSPSLRRGLDLGIRRTFADIGQTVASNFDVESTKKGSKIYEII